MRIAHGTIVEGKVVLEGDPFAEGEKVTVLAPEQNELFELSPEDEAEMLESIAEADRGEFITTEELLRTIGAKK